MVILLLIFGLKNRWRNKKQEIRDKRNLAYAVFGDVTANKEFSYSYIYVGAMKENLEKIKNIILGEFKKVSQSLKEKELEDTKNQLVGNYRISMENSEGQMNQLLLSEIDGKAREFYEFEKNIRAVKLKDVRKLAKIKKYSFFALVPE